MKMHKRTQKHIELFSWRQRRGGGRTAHLGFHYFKSFAFLERKQKNTTRMRLVGENRKHLSI